MDGWMDGWMDRLIEIGLGRVDAGMDGWVREERMDQKSDENNTKSALFIFYNLKNIPTLRYKEITRIPL
jgi:hypothetical protein